MGKLDEKIKEYTESASDSFDNSKFYMDRAKNLENVDYGAVLNGAIEMLKYRMYKELKELAEILNK